MKLTIRYDKLREVCDQLVNNGIRDQSELEIEVFQDTDPDTISNSIVFKGSVESAPLGYDSYKTPTVKMTTVEVFPDGPTRVTVTTVRDLVKKGD